MMERVNQITKTIDRHVFIPGPQIHVEQIDRLIQWIVIDDLWTIPDPVIIRRFRVGADNTQIHPNVIRWDQIEWIIDFIVETVHLSLELIEFQGILFQLNGKTMRI